ncbi:fumarylacetoacetate hydrolase family protein [Coniochaeta sp. 2T2.1]|nr:fumarylacetoacetate hydrolase family protein [Coniochaeta sp. 2T2.1]
MTQRSWLDIPAGSDFSLSNLPFGIISYAGSTTRRPAVAIGTYALDLKILADGGAFGDVPEIETSLVEAFSQQQTLNRFAELGRPVHRTTREYLRQLLLSDTPFPSRLRDNDRLRSTSVIPLSRTQTHLPLQIGDYTDFYVGKNHAYNVGVLFRGPANALQPNYTHLPVGYHGRASSVVVSGTPVRRPWGQILNENKEPIYHPTRRLDIELELGLFVCKSNKLGSPVRVTKAEEYIFGYVLMNDWSARDIQAWEYVPLGPFNSKNFATTISAWVVLADALEPYRTEGIVNDTPLKPYLDGGASSRGAFDINLEVTIKGRISHKPTTITRSNARHLLWSFPQMIAHHTVGGCPLNAGDLLGSGTISGTGPKSQGSLLELTDGGKQHIEIDTETRKFLEDGDEVTITGWCGGRQENTGERVGFGECRAVILEGWPEGYDPEEEEAQ